MRHRGIMRAFDNPHKLAKLKRFILGLGVFHIRQGLFGGKGLPIPFDRCGL
jgi:hypothetical protein